MNPSKLCDFRLFYNLHIYVCLTFLKLLWMMPTSYEEVHGSFSSNWRSCKQLFHKVGFPMLSQKFLSISDTSLPVSICISKSKLLILTFSIMSFFFCSLFSTFLFLFFTEKTSILVSFSSSLSMFFFLNLHTAWKWFFF